MAKAREEGGLEGSREHESRLGTRARGIAGLGCLTAMSGLRAHTVWRTLARLSPTRRSGVGLAGGWQSRGGKSWWATHFEALLINYWLRRDSHHEQRLGIWAKGNDQN